MTSKYMFPAIACFERSIVYGTEASGLTVQIIRNHASGRNRGFDASLRKRWGIQNWLAQNRCFGFAPTEVC